MGKVVRGLVTFMLVVSLCGSLRAADEALCAVVVIQIEQEVAFERQAFRATMEITNALEGIDLQNVDIDVLFTDEFGNPVAATSNPDSTNGEAFFLGAPTLQGIDNIDSGTIAASTAATVQWEIIPTATAAADAPAGKLYFVGATLSYTYGGKQDHIEVSPDTIVVKPLPELVLDYFLTQEVIGDDAFTPAVEPPVPYHLGLRVTNNGYGTAKNFTVESAQPEIVENEQGLAIGFKIIGSFVNEEPTQESLLVNLGNVAGGSISTARWIMETSLSGKFLDINAEFTHADELGGQLTSVVEAVNAHLMVRDVRVNLPNRDDRRDFLLEKTGSFYVYESEKTGANETVCSDCLAVGYYPGAALGAESVSGSYAVRTLSVTDINALAPGYIKVADPYGGAKDILSVQRADGSVVDQINAWVSQERDENDPAVFNYFINLFDAEPASSYTITFVDKVIAEQPPVFQAVNPVTVNEGEQVGFLVRATDPNGDTFSLTASRMPFGATFQRDNETDGTFLWSTAAGNAGQYQAVFEANDGLDVSTLTVPITVQAPSTSDPDADTDGDGIPDVVETRWGLDPNDPSDALGDADGDGYTNLQEWEAGSDPFDSVSTPVTVARLAFGSSLPVGSWTREVEASTQGPYVYALVASTLRVYERDLLTGALTEKHSYTDNQLYSNGGLFAHPSPRKE